MSYWQYPKVLPWKTSGSSGLTWSDLWESMQCHLWTPRSSTRRQSKALKNDRLTEKVERQRPIPLRIRLSLKTPKRYVGLTCKIATKTCSTNRIFFVRKTAYTFNEWGSNSKIRLCVVVCKWFK